MLQQNMSDTENLQEGVEEVAEETTVDTAETEENADESTDNDSSSDDKTDDDADEAGKQRARSQIDRLKKERDDAKAELAKLKGSPKGTDNAPTANDALLARLENRGVMDKDAQEYVIKFAKAEGISPIDALSDEVVKDKLAFFKKVKEQRASTFQSPNRTGGKIDDVEKWVAKYKKDGSLPEGNPKLVSKILDRLR